MQENVNIPDSNITANLTFRQLVLMNMQQLTNFPYIEKDFDALTDYELLCLVVKYLNEVITNQNEQNDSITSMYNAFLALQSYVNDTKDTLESAFNTLDDYVRNFFDNLDVQDEIDNKLDEYVADGTLEHIIASYLQTQKIYNTFSDMLLDSDSLVNGLTVQTLGYYSLNDGGGAFYKITDTESLSEYQEEVGDLYATLLLNKEMNVLQFGLLENTNETTKLQKILSIASQKNMIIDGLNKEFIINGTNQVGSNYGLTISGEMTLQNIKFKVADSVPDLTCALIVNVLISENVYINNIEINGNILNQSTSTASQDGGLHGIRVVNGKVNITNSIIYDCYTDGIISLYPCEVNITNSEIYGNGRNGITENSNIGIIDNCYIHNNGSRTNPKSGLHVEPDAASTKQLLQVTNTKIINNTGDDFKIHYNNQGHVLNKIYINKTEIGKYGTSLNDNGVTTSQINEVTIENSSINNYFSVGNTASTTLTTGIKKLTFNNTILQGISMKNRYKTDILINNCRVKSYIWNYDNIGRLSILNSNLIYDADTPTTDSQVGVCIMGESTHNIDELIVDNCISSNHSRFTRGNTISKVSIVNSNISSVYVTVTGTFSVCELINNKFASTTSSRLLNGTMTDVVRIGNDFRGISILTLSDANIVDSANLTDA